MASDGVQLRAWRVCIDPNRAQLALLAQHAGAARWAFNYALGRKVAAHRRFTDVRDEILAGVGEPSPAQMKTAAAAAREQAGAIPSYVDNLGVWRTERGDQRADEAGVSPWWPSVSSYAISSGMRAADAAFKGWLDSLAGRRAGRRVGYPRFKRKGRCRDSFTLYHYVKKPTIRVVDARHLLIPRIGTVRLHSNLRRLVRLLERDGGQVRSVTVSRQGGRWYASVLVAHPQRQVSPTRNQLRAGRVGVDLGVKVVATLSDGTTIPNPRHAAQDRARLVKAQRAYARTRRGSANRAKAARRLAIIKARVAERRRSWLHQVSHRLVAGWAEVAIEDLNVAGMTRSARGTVERPGRRVAQKAGLNRAILDVGFGEFRRQLTYKAVWHGSVLLVVDRWLPSSKTCSSCGWVNPNLTLAERTFHCQLCEAHIDRDLNAAINIAAAAAPQTPASPDTQRMGEAIAKLDQPTDNSPQPDTRDKRAPEASYRAPTEPTRAQAQASLDVGRPPTQGATPTEQSVGVPHSYALVD